MESRIGFGTRLGAALIDWVVIIVGGMIVGGVLGVGLGTATGADEGAIGGFLGAL